MLRLENIKKDFSLTKDQVTQVLKGISVQFRSCEFVSILGHSGCGKTTLLNIVGGLDKCTSGEVYLDGVSTKDFTDADWNDFRNRQIGFVFQSYNLIPHQTVLRNVEMPLILAEVPDEERKQRALAALEKVGLKSQAKKHPMQLSGGQMQRVAIARALVNNPSIILADEPTGALDSESGRQVMDILKEISKEKLVVMVTHNDVLANEYSTRIINMNDGQIVGDSNEYTLVDCLAAEEQDRLAWEEEEKKRLEALPPKKRAKKKPAKKKRFTFRHKGNTHMSFATAIRLSASNLYSKKGRSFLTSLAGSIGIIGIMLVLCLSNGATTYINSIEENALSIYPMTVSTSNPIDLTSLLSILQSKNDKKEKYPNSDIISTNDILGNLRSNLADVTGTLLDKKNDLAALKKYIQENFDDRDGYVKYDYGTDFTVFCNYTDSEQYMQVDPFLEGMMEILKTNTELADLIDSFGLREFLEKDLSDMFNVWEQLPDNQQLLTSQYDLVGKNSRWPTAWNEVVLIVDEQNQINDYELFATGLAKEDALISAVLGEKAAAMLGFDATLPKEFTVDDLLSVEYRVMTASDYYVKVVDEEGNVTWDDQAANVAGGYNYRRSIEYVEAHSEKINVVGVIRPKQGVSITCMNGIIGYNESLQKHLSERAQNSDIYKAQMANPDKALVSYVGNNLNYVAGDSLGDSANVARIQKFLGVADFDTPTKIYFYANSFEGKANIDDFLAEYNEENKANVKYKDTLGVITGYVDSLTETITYILVGFAAISLVVSSIMIAIIIYTSVLERRKEIGVLRSIGARKKDISTVFISESGVLGVISGAIGILIAYILSLIINAILLSLLGIPGLATLTWWHPVMMIFISVALSILAGFVPARIAANKNPVECLRTE